MIMRKIYLLLLAALFLSAPMIAQTTVWNPAANPTGTGLWTEVDNWTNGLADGDIKVVFNVADAIECVLDDTISINQLVQGDGGYGSTIRIIQDGVLNTTAGWSAVAWTDTAVMVVDTGGVVTFGEHLWLGWNAGSFGTLILNGGTVNVSQMFGTSFEGSGGKGETYVKSGVLNLNGFDAAKSIPDGSMMDITNGTVIMAGGRGTTVETLVAAGKITAFGGVGEVIVEMVDGNTVITGFDPTAPRDITDEMPIKFVGEFDDLPWDGPGTGSPAGEALPFLFDNDYSTKYLSGMTTSWVDVITTVKSTVTSYTITSANDAPERDLRDWRFMGWNEMDGKWDTIHMVDDNPSWSDFATPLTWTFDNDMAYSTYRLSIDSVNGGTLMQVAEFEIFGVVGESIDLDVTDWGLVDLTSEFDDIPWDGVGTGSPGGEIPPYLVDNDTLTKILTGNTDVWIDVLTNHMSVITGYTITSANDSPGRDPKDWTLQGWNADSAMWDTLHVVADNPAWDTFYLPKTWIFDNEMAYSKYRLDIDSVNGEPLMQISELELWGTLGEEVKVDITDLRDDEFKGQYEDLPWDGPGTGSPDGEALPFLFDNDTTTKYLVGIVEGYVDILTPRKSMISSYTITSANDAPDRDLSSWVIQGLNPMTLEWMDIHTVTDQAPWAERATPMTWEFENEGWYSTYRFQIIANNGGGLLQIAELEIFGMIGDTVTILRPDYPSPPTVVSIDPVNFATDVAVDASVMIVFSEAMSASSMAESLAITPEIPNMNLKWSIFGETLTITGDMEGETTYMILVPEGTLDAQGDALAADFRSQFTTEVVVGIEDKAVGTIGFYPNPASSTIYLTNKSIADVTIFSEVGQIVMVERNVTSLNVESLAPGRYLVKVSNNESVTVSSLIIE